MSTTIRPEISGKKKYWISKERYYELKHFCMQYPEWKRLYSDLSSADYPGSILSATYSKHLADRTSERAVILVSLRKKMSLIEDCACKSDPILCEYILKAVTENRPYVYFETVMHIPCGKDMFYDRYRKFFWLLSNERD